MADSEELSSTIEPLPSAVNVAHIVYGLHTIAIITGLVGSISIIFSFVGSIPSIIAVIINYVKQGDARGTWVASHYRWQIRTFWFAVLWFFIATVLIFTLVGIVIAIPLLAVVTIWVIYRVTRGWLRLRDGLEMYVDD